MINCTIAKTNFKFTMVSKLMNHQFKKYEADFDDDFVYMESRIVEKIEVPNRKPDIKTKYYEIYYEGDSIVQIQIDDNFIYGKIIYKKDECYIEMTSGGIERKEYLFTEYAALYYILKKQEAILIHSSAIKYKDKGILFIAKSGTGKSTQARLWKQYEDIVQINDDKNILMEEDGKLMIYGNPWSGKSVIDENIKVELTDLIFIYQNKENVIRNLTKREQMLLLLPQITNSSFMYDKNKWDRLTNKLLLIDAKYLGCTISQEAVETLKNSLEAK